jgi:hypothetical protein
MRSGLLSDIVNIGYEIFLDGDHVRLRYRKRDNPPDTVRPLIDELRRCKDEVVSILKAGETVTPTKQSQSRVNVMGSWTPTDQSLIDWFLTLNPPTDSFYLEPHLHITDPVKFFSALKMDIEAGQDGPRGKYGALIYDLTVLKRILH